MTAVEWCNGCWLRLEERVGVWLLGLRWGLCCCCCWDNLISIADALPDTEGTDDTDTEGTNFLSGEYDADDHMTTIHTCCKDSTFSFLWETFKGLVTKI